MKPVVTQIGFEKKNDLIDVRTIESVVKVRNTPVTIQNITKKAITSEILQGLPSCPALQRVMWAQNQSNKVKKTSYNIQLLGRWVRSHLCLTFETHLGITFETPK